MPRSAQIWRYNFHGRECLAWTEWELLTALDECDQYCLEIPTLWVADIGPTTWEEHAQLEALGHERHGEW
jgi:hypothetical protein